MSNISHGTKIIILFIWYFSLQNKNRGFGRRVEGRAVVAAGDAAQLRAGLGAAGAVPQPGLQGSVQRHRAADGRGAADPVRAARVRPGGAAVPGLPALVPRRRDHRLAALPGRQLHGRAARLAAPGDRQHPLLLHPPLHNQCDIRNLFLI